MGLGRLAERNGRLIMASLSKVIREATLFTVASMFHAYRSTTPSNKLGIVTVIASLIALLNNVLRRGSGISTLQTETLGRSHCRLA